MCLNIGISHIAYIFEMAGLIIYVSKLQSMQIEENISDLLLINFTQF